MPRLEVRIFFSFFPFVLAGLFSGMNFLDGAIFSFSVIVSLLVVLFVSQVAKRSITIGIKAEHIFGMLSPPLIFPVVFCVF